jgi:hypothetical protein
VEYNRAAAGEWGGPQLPGVPSSVQPMGLPPTSFIPGLSGLPSGMVVPGLPGQAPLSLPSMLPGGAVPGIPGLGGGIPGFGGGIPGLTAFPGPPP